MSKYRNRLTSVQITVELTLVLSQRADTANLILKKAGVFSFQFQGSRCTNLFPFVGQRVPHREEKLKYQKAPPDNY